MTYQPPPTQITEINTNTGQPAIRVTLWWLGAVAVFLAIILEAAAIVAGIMLAATLHGIADNLGRLEPAPTVTGCPFGDTNCGG